MSNTIVCIGREYGSGGREIGGMLDERLNIKCYDKLLLQRVAEEHNIPLAVVSGNDEAPVRFDSFITGNPFADTADMTSAFYSQQQMVFESQRKTIISVAKNESCIIIGRCSSYILRDAGINALSVFIYGDHDEKVNRIAERNGISVKEAAKRMSRVDHLRKRYHDFNCDTEWGSPESYDLMINSTRNGIEGSVELILKAIEAGESWKK